MANECAFSRINGDVFRYIKSTSVKYYQTNDFVNARKTSEPVPLQKLEIRRLQLEAPTALNSKLDFN